MQQNQAQMTMTHISWPKPMLQNHSWSNPRPGFPPLWYMDLSSSMSSSPQIIPNRHFDVGAMLNQWLKRPPFRLRRSTRTQAALKPIVIHGETSSAEAYEAVFVASQSVPAHQFISPLIAWRGHGESEPRSVGVLATTHGMTLLMQRTKTQNHNSTKVSLSAPMPRSSGLPVALSAQRHGDFPRSISGSKLPVCSLRGHASPALQTARWHIINTK